MEPKKVYRSRSNRMVAGVCGGLAAYFNVDPTIVRLIAALAMFTIGFGLGGIIAYFVCAAIIPEGPA